MLRDHFRQQSAHGSWELPPSAFRRVMLHSAWDKGIRKNMGGPGDQSNFHGLCSFMKVSCLLHGPNDKTKKCLIRYEPTTDKVREFWASPADVLSYLRDPKNPPIVQVAYNGHNHYDAYLVPDSPSLTVPKDLRSKLLSSSFARS